jgi:hypothetical protein
MHTGRSVDHPGPDRLVEHRPVVDPLHVVVGPGVGMGVEVDEGDGAELLGIGAKDREGDVVVAPEGHRSRPGGKDAPDMGGERVREGRNSGVVEGHVAAVHDLQFLESGKGPAIGRIEGLEARCLADRAGAEAGAGAVRHGLVEWHAGDGEVHPGQVLRIAAAQEARRATEGVFEGQTPPLLARKREIHFLRCIFQRHANLLHLGRIHPQYSVF